MSLRASPGDPNIMLAEWHTDQDDVVLEINQTSDGEVSTIYKLLTEMEQTGLVDMTLNGHRCERPSGALEAETDSFDIRPKDGGSACTSRTRSSRARPK